MPDRAAIPTGSRGPVIAYPLAIGDRSADVLPAHGHPAYCGSRGTSAYKTRDEANTAANPLGIGKGQCRHKPNRSQYRCTLCRDRGWHFPRGIGNAGARPSFRRGAHAAVLAAPAVPAVRAHPFAHTTWRCSETYIILCRSHALCSPGLPRTVTLDPRVACGQAWPKTLPENFPFPANSLARISH
jgi:hypothetical protein